MKTLEDATRGIRHQVRGVWLCLACAAISMASCGKPPSAPPETEAAAEGAKELHLVVVGEFPAAAVEELGELLAWLNTGLSSAGLHMRAQVARSVPEAADWLATGKADFYLDSPYPILLARSLSGCRPVLRRWKYGSPTYGSALFVREDSGIRELADLLGKTLAFEDRYSSSSFFLPVDHLLAAGLEGTFIGSAEDPVPVDRLGFVFSGGDANTMHWVLAGKVAAGAMNPWNLDQLSADSRDQLRILATTEEVPRHLLAVRSDLDPAIEAKVLELLRSADASSAGREMLASFSSTDRFDEIPEAFQNEIDPLQESVVRLDALVSSSGVADGGP